ncbi:MAG: hypothetical protein R3E31_06190 [Chloroflexota bacterium]|nr:hypothetical protein [Anaerolineales bacterium]MCB8965343.1 hypothetical protein [Ardenticatenaceae bacterium]
MHTIMLRNNVRKTSDGKSSFSIEVLGDSPVKDDVKASINALEHHPAIAARRSIIDMLTIIEKHNFQIRYTERSENEDGAETWQFILQG